MGEQETTDIDITEEEMMLEAVQIMKPKVRKPGQLTVSIFCEKTGLSRRGAMGKLDAFVNDGVLSKSTVFEDGHQINVYEPNVDGGWKDVIRMILED